MNRTKVKKKGAKHSSFPSYEANQDSSRQNFALQIDRLGHGFSLLNRLDNLGSLGNSLHSCSWLYGVSDYNGRNWTIFQLLGHF